MDMQRLFHNLRFPESVIRRAISVFRELSPHLKDGEFSTLMTHGKEGRWNYDDVEDFFAAFPEASVHTQQK